ncbi:putative alcohol dehydrogenase, zinc-type, GroES-like superfamily, NAD(P)-binding domain superfamily [Septoria linicola]|nr:putative alcohol dehydrogenase, zinc-type, GroES-like superfamily, NAD(P)-binding domain superfamily [Septoria linicola]
MATNDLLNKSVRQAFLHGAGDVRIEQVPHPPLLPGHIALAPKFCGICGSDLHFFHDVGFADTLKTPHPITGAKLPVATGHEFAGVVTGVGEGCGGELKVGDKVAIMPTIYDGTCSSCVAGATNTCSQSGYYGINSKTGGMSDGAVIPEELVFKLPDGIDCDVGALIEPLAVAWHAIGLAPGSLTAQTTALILGAGPVGAAVLVGLKAKGVTRIAVSELSAARREFISQIDSDAVALNPMESNLPTDLRTTFQRPDGMDLVFDCAGVGPTMDTAIACARPRGTIINLFVSTSPTTFHSLPMTLKELFLRSSIAYTKEDFTEVIEAIAQGKMDPRRLITKRIKLEDVVEEGLVSLHHKDNKNCKILVDLSL